MGDTSGCVSPGGGCKVHDGRLGTHGRGSTGAFFTLHLDLCAVSVSELLEEFSKVSYILFDSSSGFGSDVMDSGRGASGRLLNALILLYR